MREQRIEFYKAMKRIRMVEAAIADNYNNKVREMRTPIHLYDGQEAIAVGVCSNLNKEDFIFSNHRCHGHYLAKGGNLNKMMAELHNKSTGCCKGRGGSMHLMDKENGIALASAIVAGNVSIGTGYALVQKMRQTPNISVVFFGDGASEEGSVYESICFAKLFSIPVIFVCENNLYSIATPYGYREPEEDISSKFKTILPAKKIDGNNVEVVYKEAKILIEKARNGEGPALLECMTYRFRDHHNTGNGVDGRFRTEEEIVKRMQNCPIKQLTKILLEKENVTKEYLEDINKSIEREIKQAFEYARKSDLPIDDSLYDGMWG